MYQKILYCTDGSPAADVAGDYAVWFAKRLGACLRALYITDIRLLEGPWMTDLSSAVGAQAYSALLPQLERIQNEKDPENVLTLMNAVKAGTESLEILCRL